MSKPVKVGVLGLGQRGLQHLKALWALQEAGRAEVVGLCDVYEPNLDPDKLATFVPGFQADSAARHTSFDRMLSDTKPDAVYVCIPPGVHNGEVIEAAQKGIHLFVEKPMSLFLDEAREMDLAISEAGVLSATGFQRRYEALSVSARDYLADKRMVMVSFVMHGALESHSVKHTQTGEQGGPSDNVWAKSFAWSGSTVVEAGIHQTDLMRYWCGDIVWTQAAYVPRDPEDVEDGGDNPYAYSVTFGFESGALGVLTISRLRKVFRNDGHQSVLWDHGHLGFEGADLVAYSYGGPYPPAERPSKESLRHVVASPTAVDSTLEITRAFVEAVSSGDSALIRSPFGDAMNSLAAVLAANISHERAGERVVLEAFLNDARYEAYRKKR